MSQRWVTADPHFYHTEIIVYENRPFKNIHEMNETIIHNWNEIVHKHDKVFVLGDFALKATKEQVAEILRRLKGFKILIKGSHDDKSNKWWREAGFHEVSEYPILVDNFYLFSHEPCYINKNMPYVNIHGHLHNKRIDDLQYINMCVELHEYKPINFDIIKESFKKKLDVGRQSEKLTTNKYCEDGIMFGIKNGIKSIKHDAGTVNACVYTSVSKGHTVKIYDGTEKEIYPGAVQLTYSDDTLDIMTIEEFLFKYEPINDSARELIKKFLK